jgi:hypothetical protein
VLPLEADNASERPVELSEELRNAFHVFYEIPQFDIRARARVSRYGYFSFRVPALDFHGPITVEVGIEPPGTVLAQRGLVEDTQGPTVILTDPARHTDDSQLFTISGFALSDSTELSAGDRISRVLWSVPSLNRSGTARVQGSRFYADVKVPNSIDSAQLVVRAFDARGNMGERSALVAFRRARPPRIVRGAETSPAQEPDTGASRRDSQDTGSSSELPEEPDQKHTARTPEEQPAVVPSKQEEERSAAAEPEKSPEPPEEAPEDEATQDAEPAQQEPAQEEPAQPDPAQPEPAQEAEAAQEASEPGAPEETDPEPADNGRQPQPGRKPAASQKPQPGPGPVASQQPEPSEERQPSQQPQPIREPAPSPEVPSTPTEAEPAPEEPESAPETPQPAPEEELADANAQTEPDEEPPSPSEDAAIQQTPVSDAEHPLLEITSPTEPTLYRDRIRITGSVAARNDAPENINDVEALDYRVEGSEVSGEVLYDFSSGEFSLSIPRNQVRGTVDVLITATNQSGESTTAEVRLYDGSAPPDIELTSPGEPSAYGSYLYLRGRVTDPSVDLGQPRGVASVRYEMYPADDLQGSRTAQGSVELNSDGSFEVVVDTRDATGEQELRLQAEGKNGATADRRILLSEAAADIPAFIARPGDGRATLSWDTYPYAERYILHYTTDGSTPSASNGSVIEDVRPPIRLGNLRNGRRYTFRLRATGAEYERPQWSAPTAAIPLSRDMLTPTVQSEYRQVRVEWPGIPGTDSFEVFRAEEEDGTYMSVGTAEGTHFVDARVRYPRRYYYRVAPAMPDAVRSAPSGGQAAGLPSSPVMVTRELDAVPTADIEILGNYALALSAEALTVYDIFDIRDTKRVASLEDLSGLSASSLESLVFIAAGSDGVHVVDLTRPRDPKRLSRRQAEDARDVLAVPGDDDTRWLYVADSSAGLQVIDVTAPERPALEERLSDVRPVALARDRSMADRLFALTADRLSTFDISTPERPREVSSVAVEQGTALAVHTHASGRRLLLVGGAASVQIIDATDPASLQKRSTLQVEAPRAIAATNRADGRALVFTATTDDGLTAFDITDIDRPQPFGGLDRRDVRALHLLSQMSGHSLALLATDGGLQLADVFATGRSLEVAGAPLSGNARAVETVTWQERRYVLTAAGEGGVSVFPADDPLALSGTEPIATLETTHARDIAALETGDGALLVLIADATDGMRVARFNGSSLEAVSRFDPLGSVESVTVDRSGHRPLAFAAGTDAGTFIVDVSDPEQLTELAAVPAGEAFDLFVEGPRLYLAAGLSGLRVFDISDPRNPTELHTVSAYNAQGVVGFDRTVDSASGGSPTLSVLTPNGVVALDITEPTSPREIGFYETIHGISLSYAERLLHLSEGIRGLSTLAVTESGIRRVNTSDIEFATASAAAGSYAFVTDTRSLRVLEILIPDWLQQLPVSDG